MRFFKYLVFFLVSIVSLNSYSSTVRYSLDNQLHNAIYSSVRSACEGYISKTFSNSSSYSISRISDLTCYYLTPSASEYKVTIYSHIKEDDSLCFFPDYKIVSQPITSLKKVMCLPVNGAICKYTGDPNGSPVVNGSITTTFSSVSKTPDPSCKEELVNAPCDPKDPYGGCFTPPNDNCTRQFNGSIECPADTVPKVQKGCSNGATYCDRPPPRLWLRVRFWLL
jgi:hypothetical protein